MATWPNLPNEIELVYIDKRERDDMRGYIAQLIALLRLVRDCETPQRYEEHERLRYEAARLLCEMEAAGFKVREERK